MTNLCSLVLLMEFVSCLYNSGWRSLTVSRIWSSMTLSYPFNSSGLVIISEIPLVIKKLDVLSIGALSRVPHSNWSKFTKLINSNGLKLLIYGARYFETNIDFKLWIWLSSCMGQYFMNAYSRAGIAFGWKLLIVLFFISPCIRSAWLRKKSSETTCKKATFLNSWG